MFDKIIVLICLVGSVLEFLYFAGYVYEFRKNPSKTIYKLPAKASSHFWPTIKGYNAWYLAIVGSFAGLLLFVYFALALLGKINLCLIFNNC